MTPHRLLVRAMPGGQVPLWLFVFVLTLTPLLGPGFANVDFALAKTWGLGGPADLEFRWEVFNLFNRANFDLPNRIFGTPNFGRIFSAKNPREMQFGVRLTF